MAEPDSIASVLARGAVQLRALPAGRRDAELLLMHVVGCDRTYLLTHPVAELTSKQAAAYESWIARRGIGAYTGFNKEVRMSPIHSRRRLPRRCNDSFQIPLQRSGRN